MNDNRHNLNAAKNIKAPGRKQVAHWVKDAWDSVSPDLVKKAFFKAGVSTNVPRVQSATEDLQEDTNDLPQEETNNLDDLDDCPLSTTRCIRLL